MPSGGSGSTSSRGATARNRLRKGLIGCIRDSRYSEVVEPWIPQDANDDGGDRLIIRSRRNLHMMAVGQPGMMIYSQRRALGVMGKTSLGSGPPPQDNWAAALLTGTRPAARVAPETYSLLARFGCSTTPLIEYAPEPVKEYLRAGAAARRNALTTPDAIQVVEGIPTAGCEFALAVE